MRIYIHLKPDLKKLKKYLHIIKPFTELYSCDGIFIIEKTKIYKLLEDSHCKNIVHTHYKSHNIIIDNTIYTKTPLVSQLPIQYCSVNMEVSEYSINLKSALKLIIKTSDHPNFTPQIYFETNEKLDEYIITQDLDELLMCFYSQ